MASRIQALHSDCFNTVLYSNCAVGKEKYKYTYSRAGDNMNRCSWVSVGCLFTSITDHIVVHRVHSLILMFMCPDLQVYSLFI